METTASAKAAILRFLHRYIRREHLGPDDDIFAEGYVNSLFAAQLVTFVEKTFGIRIDDEDLDVENFRTLNAIDKFVQRKTAAQLAERG